jgi:hypothetical protein
VGFNPAFKGLNGYCSAATISYVPSYITDSAGNATKNGTKIVEHNDDKTEKAKHTDKNTQKGNINQFANMQHIERLQLRDKFNMKKSYPEYFSIKNSVLHTT